MKLGRNRIQVKFKQNHAWLHHDQLNNKDYERWIQSNWFLRTISLLNNELWCQEKKSKWLNFVISSFLGSVVQFLCTSKNPCSKWSISSDMESFSFQWWSREYHWISMLSSIKSLSCAWCSKRNEWRTRRAIIKIRFYLKSSSFVCFRKKNSEDLFLFSVSFEDYFFIDLIKQLLTF